MRTAETPLRLAKWLAAVLLFACLAAGRAQPPGVGAAKLSGRVILPGAAMKMRPPSIVVWLAPQGISPALPAPPPGRFKLVQKNRMFAPHLLVVPVGSVVSFPNQDPFFHNVFSLFNGKRFDLGLYEAGSSREVTFSRTGVSYIFCNIHPEMSAVVIALSTPLFAVADSSAAFSIHPVPPGLYDLHVWIEGVPQPDLDRLSRRIGLEPGQSSSVTIDASSKYRPIPNHLNMYGKPYPPETRSPY